MCQIEIEISLNINILIYDSDIDYSSVYIGKLSTNSNRGIHGNTDTHTEYIDKYMFKCMFRACGVSDPQNIFIIIMFMLMFMLT